MRVVYAIVAVIAVELLAVAIFVSSGAYNVAASRPHTAAGQWALNTLQARSIDVRADEVAAAPSDLRDPERVQAGARRYDEMCVVCHGAPGVERTAIGKGITPQPPDLAQAARMWNDAELFWIVKHGIKLAGMPAFGETHGDDELWPIVAFVRQLPGMSADDYRRHAEAAGPDHHGTGTGGHHGATTP